MAVTRKADVTAQIPQIWAADLYAQAEKLTFWHKYEGPPGSSMPLIRRDDLEKQPGDTVKLDIVLALTGAGLTGSTSQGLLDGNEEKMKFRQTTFTVDAWRHGVRWEKLGKILINKSMRNTALMQLRKRLAKKLDDDIFNEFSGAGSTTLPNSAKLAIGGPITAAAASDVAGTDTLTLDKISDLKAHAKATLQIEPLSMDNGEELYFYVGHDFSMLQLKKSSEWKTAQREARERGRDNPVFTGALGVYDNVVLLSSDKIIKANDGAASVPVSRDLFLGAQGAVRGYAFYPDWTEQYFSYGEEQGIGTYVVYGQKVVTFDLNAVETGGDATDDTAIGMTLVFASAPTPTLA